MADLDADLDANRANKWMRRLLPLLILGLGAGGLVLMIKMRKPPGRKKRPKAAQLVEVVTVQAEKRRVEVTSNGVVQPRREASLAAEVSGRVRWLHRNLVVGGQIKKGAPLLVIDPVDYKLVVEKARSQVAQAERALAVAESSARVARTEWKQLGQGTGRAPTPLTLHEPQIKEARALLAAARADLEMAKLNLQRTTMRAPFNLRVRSEQVEAGQYVRVGQELTRVYGTDVAEVVGGGEIPFAQAAFVEDGRGYSFINRNDRRRVINVTAKADLKVANADAILKQLGEGLLPQLQADYPGLTYDMEGQQRERRESMQSLMWGFVVALLMIYVMLAVPFRSYSQPFLVMSAIPFGIIGAVLGHLLLGFNMSLLSWMGVVALSGVVINDSLVMIDFINRLRAQGVPARQAVIDGARRRFRPIVLTTLTTFFALVPMLAETSVQARFLVPMAVSLACGVLFGTQIILMLVPALYMILEDVRGAIYRFLGREVPEPTTEQPLIEVQR